MKKPAFVFIALVFLAGIAVTGCFKVSGDYVNDSGMTNTVI